MVRWHYQWIVVHEFLAKTVGRSTVNDVLVGGRRFFKWRNDPFIPVEFSVGACRFGHSQVRPSYRANFGTSAGDPTQQFFGLIFDPTIGDGATRRISEEDDVRPAGSSTGRPSSTSATAGPARARGSTPPCRVLFELMGQPVGEPTSLASRNLLRNLTMKVPSGQRVAQAMDLPVLDKGDLDDLSQFHLRDRTPLWFYVLREAEVVAEGRRLGPVGGRIVAEVILGLIMGDRQSYLPPRPGLDTHLRFGRRVHRRRPAQGRGRGGAPGVSRYGAVPAAE